MSTDEDDNDVLSDEEYEQGVAELLKMAEEFELAVKKAFPRCKD